MNSSGNDALHRFRGSGAERHRGEEAADREADQRTGEHDHEQPGDAGVEVDAEDHHHDGEEQGLDRAEQRTAGQAADEDADPRRRRGQQAIEEAVLDVGGQRRTAAGGRRTGRLGSRWRPATASEERIDLGEAGQPGGAAERRRTERGEEQREDRATEAPSPAGG